MPGNWTAFKAAFLSSEERWDRYTELRESIGEDLLVVRDILISRGEGDLPEGTLTDIEERWETMWKLIQGADEDLDGDPAHAFEVLNDLIEPAAKLARDAEKERQAEIRLEKGRQAMKINYEDALDEINDLLQSITDRGIASPQPLTGTLNDLKSEALERAEQGRFGLATSSLRSGLEPLRELAEVAALYSAVLRRIPDDLDKTELEQVNDLKLRGRRRIETSHTEGAFDAITDLQAMLTRRARMKGVVEEISGKHPRDRLQSLTLKINDVLEFPKEFSSEGVRAHQKLVKRRLKAAESAVDKLGKKETAQAQAKKSGSESAQLRADAAAFTAREVADEAVDALENALKAAQPDLTQHNADMRSYYAKLKELRPKLELAQRLPEKLGKVASPWRAERRAFDTALKEVKDAAKPKVRDFALALKKMKVLEIGLKALLDKRLEALQNDINTATDPVTGGSKASIALIEELAKTPGLISAMKPEQQLTLLKGTRDTLRCSTCPLSMTFEAFKGNGFRCTGCNSRGAVNYIAVCDDPTCGYPGEHDAVDPCPQCGNDNWTIVDRIDRRTLRSGYQNPYLDVFVARSRMFGEMKLTPEFEDYDKRKRHDLAVLLRDDPETQEAEEQWESWVRDGDHDRIRNYLISVVRKQCAIMGHDQQNLQAEDSSGVMQDFPDLPIKVVLKAYPDSERGLAGECEPGFPTWIYINTNGKDFNNFKEIVDTVVHENSHAFQEMLIMKLKGKAPFTNVDSQNLLNDPDLGVQAQLFKENDESYVNHGDLGHQRAMLEISKQAYLHEPLEEHAWGVGSKLTKTLMVPPPIESFESSKVLRSKTWMVQILTRAKQAEITLEERHGIYGVDLGQGAPSDLSLILEGLPKGKSRKTKKVKIKKVVDDYKLLLDVDTRGYTAEVSNDRLVQATGVRLRLDERVKDL
ncbi:MAG: hypothetical protein H6741_27140 [Alphaproteobacteria bacterium]|nr:hypothetical protein [Alphaproteobacteria bacterium]